MELNKTEKIYRKKPNKKTDLTRRERDRLRKDKESFINSLEETESLTCETRR